MATGGNDFGNSPYAAGGQFAAPGQYGTPMPPAKSSNTVTIVVVILAVVLLVALLLCGVLAVLLIPAVGAAREAARRMQDSNNMKQIGLAMFNYESTYNSLPAPITTNSDGQDVWSWQVPLLPFVEATHVFDQIDFGDMRPWDDPKNAFLLDSMPPTFQSTRLESPEPGFTNVFVIATAPAGPGVPQAAFTLGEYHGLRDFTDGLSNTIMAIMFVNKSVEWARPSTLSPDEAYAALQNETTPAVVVMMDGSTRFLDPSIDKETFIGLCTRDGGETVFLP